MSSAIMTVRGFYEYLQLKDNDDLFKNMTLPSSDLLDRDTLIAEILRRSDDLEVLYANPYYMQESIEYWSKKWYRTIDKWVKALELEYNPLFNYDKHEDIIDKTSTARDIAEADSTRTITDDDSHTATDMKETVNSKDSTNTDITEVNTLSAYNSNTFQPDRSTATSGSANNNYVQTNGTTDTTGSASKNYTERDIDESFMRTDKIDDDTVKDFVHSMHAWGKDTPDKYAEMVKAELELAKWNLYEHISDLFINEYVIAVYG